MRIEQRTNHKFGLSLVVRAADGLDHILGRLSIIVDEVARQLHDYCGNCRGTGLKPKHYPVAIWLEAALTPRRRRWSTRVNPGTYRTLLPERRTRLARRPRRPRPNNRPN